MSRLTTIHYFLLEVYLVFVTRKVPFLYCNDRKNDMINGCTNGNTEVNHH